MTGDEIRDEEIVRLTRAGLSANTIASRLHITSRTVQRVRKRFGIAKPATKPLTSEELAAAAELFKDGASCSEVAHTLGRSPAAMIRHFPQCKWTHQQGVEHAVLVRRLKQLESRL